MSELTGNKYTNNITIEKMTIRGLSMMLAKRFDLKREPIFVSSTDKWNTINNLRKQKDPRAEFPFITMKMQGIEVRTEGYNVRTLNRIGQHGLMNDSANMMYKNEPLPVNIVMEVTYLTDDFYNMITFANRWLYAAVTKNLNMDIEFDGVNYSIQCEPDSNVTVPEKDMSIDMVNQYEFVSTIAVKGYMSPDRPLDEFPKVFPVSSVLLTPYLVAQPDYRGSFPPAGWQGTNEDWEKILAENTLNKTPAYIYDPDFSRQNEPPVGYEQITFEFDVKEKN